MMSPTMPPPRPAPDPLDDELSVLLDGPFTGAWRAETPPSDRAGELRGRLFDRVARSARASRDFVTVRRHDTPAEAAGAGVQQRVLYEAGRRPLRRGEPRRVRLIELAPGACWQPDVADTTVQAELLVVRGSATLADGPRLSPRDFHLQPAGQALPAVGSDSGATLYLREAPAAVREDVRAQTVFDAESPWQDFAPGIRRRVLWSQDGEAAMLYHAEPGAQVPRHAHGHDEECLMVDGEIFLDDVLLRTGDYQLAPAGTGHQGVSTDTGGVLFAHGDLDLDLQPD